MIIANSQEREKDESCWWPKSLQKNWTLKIQTISMSDYSSIIFFSLKIKINGTEKEQVIASYRIKSLLSIIYCSQKSFKKSCFPSSQFLICHTHLGTEPKDDRSVNIFVSFETSSSAFYLSSYTLTKIICNK